MISLGLLVRTMCNLITHCIALYICENTLKKNSDFLSFDRSNVPLDRSKKLKNLNSTFWLVRSIESNFRSIEKRETRISRIFLRQFSSFFMNKHSTYEHYRQRLMSKLNSIDAIALRFNLTYLNLNLNNIITSISVFIKS